MAKKIGLLVSVGMLIVGFSLSGAASAKKIKVGVTLHTRQHGFYQDLEAGLRETAERFGVELLARDADLDLAKQMADIEDFLAQEVDALVVCPVDSVAIGPAVKEAQRKGMPVFTADIAVQDGEVVSHIASDNFSGGRKAGEYLAKALGGKGKVIIIDWPRVTSVLERVAGFDEVIAQYPEIEIIARPDIGVSERAPAMVAMENMLETYDVIDGVFAINDDSALGALAAIEASGRTDIIIVGYDAVPEARRAILRGSSLKADVVQYPKRIGEVTIETIIKYLRGVPVAKNIYVEVGIVDKAALEAMQDR